MAIYDQLIQFLLYRNYIVSKKSYFTLYGIMEKVNRMRTNNCKLKNMKVDDALWVSKVTVVKLVCNISMKMKMYTLDPEIQSLMFT